MHVRRPTAFCGNTQKKKKKAQREDGAGEENRTWQGFTSKVKQTNKTHKPLTCFAVEPLSQTERETGGETERERERRQERQKVCNLLWVSCSLACQTRRWYKYEKRTLPANGIHAVSPSAWQFVKNVSIMWIDWGRLPDPLKKLSERGYQID